MSSVGYGFLWNLPSYGNLSISPENITWFSAASQNIDFWVTTTPATISTASPFAALLHQFVDAVGHAPTMPFYSTGFIQSKNRYRTQAQLLEVQLRVINHILTPRIHLPESFLFSFFFSVKLRGPSNALSDTGYGTHIWLSAMVQSQKSRP